MNNENQPLSTKGSAEQSEDQLGGTTNLSLDQLQKEGGIADPDEDSPEPSNDQDDLNEIRVGDDLDEPDAEEYSPDDDESNEDSTEDEIEGDDDEDPTEEESSSNDADGNGGYPDEAANTTNNNS